MENQDAIIFDQFGICPRCGRLMGMLEATYTMYGLTPHGQYPNRILTEEKEITYACLCGARYKMVRTPYGIFPKGYYKLDEMTTKRVKELATVIGYVDKEDNSGNNK